MLNIDIWEYGINLIASKIMIVTYTYMIILIRIIKTSIIDRKNID